MSTPDWYWSRGIHDAVVLAVCEKDIPWDPSQKNPEKNCLILKIDSDNAMFEQDITEIRFYDFDVRTDDFDLQLLSGCWWVRDELIPKGDHYLLELHIITAKHKNKILELRFRRAEVTRKRDV